jgi:hypothetical protein
MAGMVVHTGVFINRCLLQHGTRHGSRSHCLAHQGQQRNHYCYVSTSTNQHCHNPQLNQKHTPREIKVNHPWLAALPEVDVKPCQCL